MSLRAKLEAFVTAAPPDAMIPARWLAELLAGEGDGAMSPIGNTAADVDLTVAQLASCFGRGSSTIRTWLERGDFPDAYKLHGREWRVPSASLAAMQSVQSERHHTPRVSSARRTADLGAWRKHLPKAS